MPSPDVEASVTITPFAGLQLIRRPVRETRMRRRGCFMNRPNTFTVLSFLISQVERSPSVSTATSSDSVPIWLQTLFSPNLYAVPVKMCTYLDLGLIVSSNSFFFCFSQLFYALCFATSLSVKYIDMYGFISIIKSLPSYGRYRNNVHSTAKYRSECPI